MRSQEVVSRFSPQPIAFSRVAAAVAAVAAGALAVGAMAIGRLAIKRMVLGSAAIKRLRIQELEIDRLRVDQQASRPGREASLQDAPMYAYLPAKDVERARGFYEQKLGFRPREVTADGVVYQFGSGTACFLYPTPNAGTSKASQAFWEVSDVEREVARLKGLGIEFETYDLPGDRSASGVVTAGGAKAAWFKDTEGNILALIQSL
jgi:catechol 2,3-dioxygenase-like lactoylglutathione lyase family enzyme